MWALVGVAGVEVISDKVPFLDHALHVLQVVVEKLPKPLGLRFDRSGQNDPWSALNASGEFLPCS